MRKLLFFALIVACSFCAQSQVSSQDEAAKPSYKSGETWLFTAKEGGSTGSTSNPLNGTYELSIVDGKLKIADILMSHFGRPKDGPTDKYSLRHLVKHLYKLLNPGWRRYSKSFFCK